MQLMKEASAEKLRGGFYTPKPIADFILKWALTQNPSIDVLEPSCGDGVFLKSIKENQYPYHTITAIEYDAEEAEKASSILSDAKIINSDFHEYCINTRQKFDVVIGNPPYIRYQYFDKQQQIYAGEIFDRASLKYSKLTNAWVSFIVGSSLLLKEDKGKIGFVIPAEILQVSYAQTLRAFLSTFYNKINIISFEKLVFPDIQQEVVLLLCEKNSSSSHLIEHLELKDASELASLDTAKLKSPSKKIDFTSNKWTFYFLDQKEIDFLERLQKDGVIAPLGKYANVEVGITTGSNPFFTVPLSTVQFYQLEKYAKPLVGRSVQVPSPIFTLNDWQNNQVKDARAHLLAFPKKKDLNGSRGARDYIAWGEEQGIHKGYKCRIRDEWQIVPSLRVSEALFIRRNNLYPKLIINEAAAYTTDTMHRVSLKPDINIKALVASYYNSISLAFSEICGRSHGGGVLELMPNEAESILLPYHPENENLLGTIDSMIRKGKDITEVLAITNPQILQQHLGFSKSDIQLADSIWKKLSQRRLNRGK